MFYKFEIDYSSDILPDLNECKQICIFVVQDVSLGLGLSLVFFTNYFVGTLKHLNSEKTLKKTNLEPLHYNSSPRKPYPT